MRTSPYPLSIAGNGQPPVQQVARFLLPLVGWSVEGDLPDVPQFVLVVAPHTSNWDVPVGLLCAYALGLLFPWPYGVMVKAPVFRWPLAGPLMRWLGGIPIDRSAPNNVVDQMADAFQQHERLMLAITPEGTRKKTPYWKSGFYHIALKARVPIVLAYLDYARRVGGLGPTIWPSGDADADLELIRDFYAGVTAKFPHQFGEVRFKRQEAQA
jgi:1-acyl-sn-glycerol-3-phosphate acyltransferase